MLAIALDGGTLTVEQFWRLFDALVVPGHIIFGRKARVWPGKAGLNQVKAIPFATAKRSSPAILYWRWDVERKLAADMEREA